MRAKTAFEKDVDKRLGDPEFAAAYGRRRLIQEVAIEVRRMREAAGLTQARLASLIGSSQPTLARLERGHDTRAPRWDLLNRIAMALNKQLQIVFRDAAAAENDDKLVVVERPRKRRDPRAARHSADAAG
jgi:transcriptional regulator with XRE-family HTH domain